MLDNPAQIDRLLARLQSALPLAARMTPELAATLRDDGADRGASLECSITRVSYAGDAGGVMCQLEFGSETTSVAVVSLTHLRFDPRQPLSREIAVYQTHRVKRLRGRGWSNPQQPQVLQPALTSLAQ